MRALQLQAVMAHANTAKQTREERLIENGYGTHHGRAWDMARACATDIVYIQAHPFNSVIFSVDIL